MHKKVTTGGMKLLMSLAVISCIAVMILSAAAASEMYTPSSDKFMSSLCKNLAALCEKSESGLSKTQLSIIENAEIKSIRYNTKSSGERMFFARLFLRAPVEKLMSYSDNPTEYLNDTLKTMYSGEPEEIEIMGICGNGNDANSPVLDNETVSSLIQAAKNAWANEKLTESVNFGYALTDILIPEPYPDRAFSDQTDYLPAYDEWLDKCAKHFASEGLTVKVNDTSSSEATDIRSALEQIITPYLCSIRNVSVSRSDDNDGFITLTFDSLDVIGTLSAAKKPSVSALNKLAGVYSDERVLKVKIEIDLADFISDDSRMKLPFFNMIRAMTGYGSFVVIPLTKIKTPAPTQVISGKSNGQWPVEFKRAKGDGNIIIDVISIDDSGAETSVLKIFLTDGGKITVCLGKGKYRLNMAVGNTYYGSKELFGANGIYMKDTTNIYSVPSKELKTITVEKQQGESLKFKDYLLAVGTDPSLIDRAEF